MMEWKRFLMGGVAAVATMGMVAGGAAAAGSMSGGDVGATSDQAVTANDERAAPRNDASGSGGSMSGGDVGATDDQGMTVRDDRAEPRNDASGSGGSMSGGDVGATGNAATRMEAGQESRFEASENPDASDSDALYRGSDNHTEYRLDEVTPRDERVERGHGATGHEYTAEDPGVNSDSDMGPDGGSS